MTNPLRTEAQIEMIQLESNVTIDNESFGEPFSCQQNRLSIEFFRRIETRFFSLFLYVINLV